MQQEWILQPPLELILYEVFIAFVLVVSIGFYKYSKGTRFQMWSTGWISYTAGIVIVAFHQPIGLHLIDLIAIPLTLVGASIIGRSIRKQNGTSINVRCAVIAFVSGFIWVASCIILQLPLAIAYIPSGFYMSYASIISAREIAKVRIDMMIGVWGTVIGLYILAASAIFIPLLLFAQVIYFLALGQATGIIMVAASMNCVLLRLTKKELRIKTRVAQLMSEVIQHDIRNFLQVASNALYFAQTDDEQTERWLGVASETLENAQAFIDEMNEIAISLSRHSPDLSPLELKSTIEEVVGRVQMEYDITVGDIRLHIPEDSVVLTNRLANELIWNIIDNAFKHGSCSVEVVGHCPDEKTCVIRISDFAGGLPESVKIYLNKADSAHDVAPPGNGLGIGLIRGLAPLCGVRVIVEDHSDGEGLVGTVFHLEFQRATN